MRTPAGARRVRLTQLLNEHKGALDVAAAQTILADHYDVYLGEEQPGWRTIDGHTELDPMRYVSGLSGRPAFDSHGAVDGKVMDSAMAADLSISARWGNSSAVSYTHLDVYKRQRSRSPATRQLATSGR